MPTFVTLYTWTEQGIRSLKDSPARAEAAVKLAEAAGAKIIGVWYTKGEYDMIAVSEWPDEKRATAYLLAQASQGFVRTTTLSAYSPAEFAGILKMMP